MLKHTQGRGCILIPLFLPKFQLIRIVKSSYFSTHISLYLRTYIFHCYPSLHYFLGTLLESSLRGCGRMQLPEPCDGSHCEQSVLGSDWQTSLTPLFSPAAGAVSLLLAGPLASESNRVTSVTDSWWGPANHMPGGNGLWLYSGPGEDILCAMLWSGQCNGQALRHRSQFCLVHWVFVRRNMGQLDRRGFLDCLFGKCCVFCLWKGIHLEILLNYVCALWRFL